MHYSKLFNKVYYDNQQVFNKKLNWYFDIKNILFTKKTNQKIIENTNQLVKEYSSLKNLSKNKKKSFFKPKYFMSKNFLNKKDIIFRRRVINSINFLKKNKIDSFLCHFLIQGSLATNDYKKDWSDFDSIGVIKDDVLKNSKKMIVLRNLLKIFYKKVIKFSQFQHHGIIFFTNYDLKNFLPGYIPIEALRNKSLSILKPKTFEIDKITQKQGNLSKMIILNRKKYILKGIKDKCYDHHVFNKVKLSIPIRQNEKTLKQLFVHIGFMLNIPILYLDAVGKSSHKKSSFKKFYKIIGNSSIIQFIKKHEYLRSNWEKFFKDNKEINKKLSDYLGKKYFNECLYTINYCLKKIN